MAEAFNDRRLAGSKADRYAEVALEIASVLEGEPNLTARMATVASMLAATFEHYFWTGFYVVDPDKPGELVVGPYQGTLGCLRIPFGRGVCGAAAASGQVQLVPDVHAFPGHIACDSRSASEVVAPVFDATGALIAVFDVDSEEKAAFDETDAQGLVTILAQVFAGAEGPQADAAGPHPPPDGAGRRPGGHAGRADPGDGAGAGEDRHVDR